LFCFVLLVVWHHLPTKNLLHLADSGFRNFVLETVREHCVTNIYFSFLPK
jgi:hypothetical protein